MVTSEETKKKDGGRKERKVKQMVEGIMPKETKQQHSGETNHKKSKDRGNKARQHVATLRLSVQHEGDEKSSKVRKMRRVKSVSGRFRKLRKSVI